jgi:hypothetical protein
VAETLGGLLSESDLVTHAFELLDEAPLIGNLLLALDEVITAELLVGLAQDGVVLVKVCTFGGLRLMKDTKP